RRVFRVVAGRSTVAGCTRHRVPRDSMNSPRTRAPIAGAQIKALPEGRNSSPAVVSDQDGNFSLALEPGKYTLRISKDRFVEVSQRVELGLDGLQLEETILQLAPVSSTVTVTESPGYVTPTTASATKTPTPLADIPQSITIIAREQIKDQMMMSISDVVNYV